MCDPNTVSSSLPADTLDSDFTYAFSANQSIVTPSNHSKQSVIGYLCTTCQVMMYPNTLPTIQYTCLSNAKSTLPHQLFTERLNITDSGAKDYFSREKSYFISYTEVTGKFIMMANGASYLS
jgi:hypothetical protein